MLRIWFESDGQPWVVASLSPNKHGVIRCRNLLTGRNGWHWPSYVAQHGRVVVGQEEACTGEADQS